MVVISIINIMVWTSVVTLLIILQLNVNYANAFGLYHPYSNKLQLKNLLYITHVNGSTIEGSLAKLDCKKGYYVNGPKNPYAKCVSDKWDIDDKYLGCVRIKCDNPHQLEIQHGKINTFNISDRFSESYLQDSIYWVTCDEGFKPKGHPVRRCMWNDTHGVWSQPADKYGEKLLEGGDSHPICEEDPHYINYSCPDPHKLTIKNGKINTFSISDRSSEDYLQDSIYWVTCDDGFKPKGNPARRFLWNGTHGIWSRPADIYGEKLLLDGDSPPVCEVDPITISMGFFIVIYLIGFIGTGCAVCMVKLKQDTIGRLMIIEITSRTKPCDWNFKRFWQGLLFAVFFFVVPIALFCEVCKRKLKTEQNDGQGQNQPLAEEYYELAAQTRQQLTAQIHQLTEDKGRLTEDNQRLTEDKGRLTEDNQRLTEDKGRLTAQNQQITDEKRQLTTQNQQITEENGRLTTQNQQLTEENGQLTTQNQQLTTQNQQNNQDIADMLTKINEQITRTDELSGQVEQYVTAGASNHTTVDDAQRTPSQTLMTQIDKLKVKHGLLSGQIEQLIVQKRQPNGDELRQENINLVTKIQEIEKQHKQKIHEYKTRLENEDAMSKQTIQKANSRIDELTDTLEELTDKCSQLEQYQELKEENIALKEKLRTSDVEEENKELKKDNKKMQNTMSTIKRELQGVVGDIKNLVNQLEITSEESREDIEAKVKLTAQKIQDLVSITLPLVNRLAIDPLTTASPPDEMAIAPRP